MRRTVRGRWGRQVALRVDRETIPQKLAEWMLSKGDEVIDGVKIAKFLVSYMIGMDISESTVRQKIGLARAYAEIKLGKTIWNVRGEGWRIASEKEKAIFLVRSARTTIKYAERTRRLHTITNPKLVPEAMEYVFGSAPKAQEAIEQYGKRFSSLFKYTKELTA